MAWKSAGYGVNAAIKTAVRPQCSRQWCVDHWTALHPHSMGGSYVNLIGAQESVERVRATYRGHYDRLASIKGAYDPDNLFHANQNIRPSRSDSTDHRPYGHVPHRRHDRSSVRSTACACVDGQPRRGMPRRRRSSYDPDRRKDVVPGPVLWSPPAISDAACGDDRGAVTF